MAFSTFLVFSLLLSSTLASPVQIRSSPITLHIALNVNATGGAQALVNRDRARFRAIFAHGQAKSSGENLASVPVPATDAIVTYTANIGVCGVTYTVIVDTGSSNTWIGAGKGFTPCAGSTDTGQRVSVTYGSGSFSGEEFIVELTIGSATIRQSIGIASTSTGFSGVDGILGIGPDDLTEGTLSGGGIIPTVTDNLFSQGFISSPLVGISFVPTTSSSNVQNGELDFGATDPSKFTGSISFVPITRTSPASEFWGIDESITYGSSGIPILSTTAGIVDTGTTLVLLATNAFNAYKAATGATLDPTTGLLKVTNPNSLQSLFFNIGGTIFEFTANAQIWPRALNSLIGGTAGATYLIVNDLGSPSGQGLDFIDGFTFLQRFYSVFDTANSQVGFATTPHTHDTTN